MKALSEFNENDVRNFYQFLGHKNETEIRMIPPEENKPRQLRQFFVKSEGEFVKMCEEYNGQFQVYAGLNERTPQGTKNEDVPLQSILLIDIDPKRPKNTSASSEQIAAAAKAKEELKAFLRSIGSTPIESFSGNGYHLLIKIPPTPPAKIALKLRIFYEQLRNVVSVADVNIDATHDAARVCKVPGTLSIKGKEHRLAVLKTHTNVEPSQQLLNYILSLESEKTVTQTTTLLGSFDEKLQKILERDAVLRDCLDGNYEPHVSPNKNGKKSESEAEMLAANRLYFYGLEDHEIDHVLSTKSQLGKWRNATPAYRTHTLRKIIRKNRFDWKRVSERNSTQAPRDFPSIESFFNKKNAEGKFIPKRLAEALGYTNFLTLSDTDEIYFWDKRIFKPAEALLRTRIAGVLQNEYQKRRAEETLDYIKAVTYKDREDMNLPTKYLPVENGLYNWEEEKLEPFSDRYFITATHPIHFDPDADCPENHAFWEEVLNPEDKKLAEEIFGYCLYRAMPIHKAFMFTGTGRNGKTTFLETLTAFLGPQNVSHVHLHQLCNPNQRFYASELYQKNANICGDLPPRALKDTGLFKMAVGGDTLIAEKKFHNPFSFKSYAKMAYSANTLPATHDVTDAFFRRWLILEFPNEFEGKNADKDKLAKLTTPAELSGLFNVATKALNRLLTRGDFKNTRSTNSVRDDYLLRSDPLSVFLKQEIEKDLKSEVSKDDLYDAYQEFCEEHDAKPESRTTFFDRIKTYFRGVKQVRPRKGDDRVYMLQGIKLKRDSNENPDGPSGPGNSTLSDWND